MHCTTQQHIAITLTATVREGGRTRGNTLQHTAITVTATVQVDQTHCNTLQHAATHCNYRNSNSAG